MGGSLSIRMKGGERVWVDNEGAAGYCGGIRIEKKKTIKKWTSSFDQFDSFCSVNSLPPEQRDAFESAVERDFAVGDCGGDGRVLVLPGPAASVTVRRRPEEQRDPGGHYVRE